VSDSRTVVEHLSTDHQTEGLNPDYHLALVKMVEKKVKRFYLWVEQSPYYNEIEDLNQARKK
jgi:hypothetical protein